jgi:hypothetical protein
MEDAKCVLLPSVVAPGLWSKNEIILIEGKKALCPDIINARCDKDKKVQWIGIKLIAGKWQ